MKRTSPPVWFDNFDIVSEISALIDKIERATDFTLTEKRRQLVFSYAEAKLEDAKRNHLDDDIAVSRSAASIRRFLVDIQETVFLAIPYDNLALMPLSEYVLNDPCYYEAALIRAASMTEDDVYNSLLPTLQDCTIREARETASTTWRRSLEDSARRYAEALTRPEREIHPFQY